MDEGSGEERGGDRREVMTNTANAFRQAIEKAGLVPPDTIIEDGKLHRFSSNGDRADDSGWYALFSDETPAGVFGCWRTGLNQTWFRKADATLTTAERDRQRARFDKAKRQREQDEQRRRAAAAERAQRLWDVAKPATAQHPYLVKKLVQPHSLRLDAANRLIVPVTISGRLTSLQTIDANGEKLFLPGGLVQGGSFTMGMKRDDDTIVLLAESFGTGASLHEGTGYPVVVAFSAGGLAPVVKQLRQQWPTDMILVFGDNDFHADGKPNTGLLAATATVSAIKGVLVMPEVIGGKEPTLTTYIHTLALMPCEWRSMRQFNERTRRG